MTKKASLLAISYKPLWKLLIDRNMKKQDLRQITGLSGATIAKLGRNENVTTGILVRICSALDCTLGEVAEIMPVRHTTNETTERKDA